MPDKKLDSLSSEELLKALESKEPTTIEVDHPILSFVKKLGLKKGDFAIPILILWEVFNKLNPQVLPKSQFIKEVKYFLPINYHGRLLLDRDTISLYAEILKVKIKPTKNPLSNEAGRRHFEAFVSKLDIKRGNHKIPPIILYHIYRCYCIDNKKKQFSMPKFGQYATFYFDKKIRGRECNYYLVDQKTANIIQQKEYNGIKEIYARRRKKTKKEQKKPV